MEFWFEFLDIHMNEKQQLAMIAMVLNDKNIYSFYFDYFP
jgi:hypothetical protein